MSGRGVRSARAARRGLLGAGLALLACADATGPRWVADLRLEPDSLHLVPGETATFGAVPLDQHGEPLADRATRVSWRLNNSAVASIETGEGSATITGVALGATSIQATLGRGSRNGLVLVHPPGLDRIAITPSPIEMSFRGSALAFAELYDAQGRPLDPQGHRISWKGSNNDVVRVGSVNQAALGPKINLFGQQVGQITLTLTVNDMTTTAQIIVR